MQIVFDEFTWKRAIEENGGIIELKEKFMAEISELDNDIREVIFW